jgi:hypothetical protein
MNPRAPWKAGKIVPTWATVVFQRKDCSQELVGSCTWIVAVNLLPSDRKRLQLTCIEVVVLFCAPSFCGRSTWIRINFPIVTFSIQSCWCAKLVAHCNSVTICVYPAATNPSVYMRHVTAKWHVPTQLCSSIATTSPSYLRESGVWFSAWWPAFDKCC